LHNFVLIGLKDESAFPCLYALLPGKSQGIYESMMRQVKNLCPNLKPTYIMTDFELAAANVFRSVYKNAKGIGCYFYFKQAVLRKFQKYNDIWKSYKKDLNFTQQMHMLFALAYVPPADVLRSFDDLLATDFFRDAYDYEDGDDTDDRTKALSKVLAYFEKTWLRKINIRTGKTKAGQFAIEKWNVYDSVLNGHHKTNNYCEGFNAGFNAILQAANPTLWKFINDLKLQHEIGIKGISDIITGIAPAPPRKRAKYLDLNTRMLAVVRKYTTFDTPVKYLDAITACI